jgi:hypothetical protein
MTPARVFGGLLIALAVAGCTAHRLKGDDDQLVELNRQCAAVDQRGDPTPCRQRYEQLAAAALAEGRKSGADVLTRVAFYRVAATAAFDAGPLGTQTLTESTDEGTQACEQLPQKDASAPRDCALIRLAFPLGVTAELSRRLDDVIRARDALRKTNPSAQLPASDLPTVLALYDGFETQFDKVSALRAHLGDAAPDQLMVYEDDQRRAIYCWALEAYSVAFDVTGTTPASLAQLTARKTALRQRAEQSLGVIDCRSTRPIAVAP